LLLLLFVITYSQATLPVVLWHGMGDTCCFPFSMGKITDLIKKYVPSYVYSIRVGDNIEEDEMNGFFKNVNHQVDYVCDLLKKKIINF